MLYHWYPRLDNSEQATTVEWRQNWSPSCNYFLLWQRASSVNSDRVQHCAIRQKCQKPWCHSRFKIIHDKTCKQSVSDNLKGASKDHFKQTVLNRWSSQNPNCIARLVSFGLWQLSACRSSRLSRLDYSNFLLAGVTVSYTSFRKSKILLPLNPKICPKRTLKTTPQRTTLVACLWLN